MILPAVKPLYKPGFFYNAALDYCTAAKRNSEDLRQVVIIVVVAHYLRYVKKTTAYLGQEMLIEEAGILVIDP